MGEDLLELLERLTSNEQEKVTSQELNVLLACRAHALKEITVCSAGAAAGVTWLATRRLSTFFRIKLSVGAAVICGSWILGRTLDSCTERILSQDGSRMQMELANIVLRKHGDDSTTKKVIAKYFYPEKVFDDSSTDEPKIRWCHRNSFSDEVPFSQRTQSSYACDYGDKSHESDVEKTDNENTAEIKHVSTSPGMDDAFDYVFGITGSSDEIHHPNTSGTSQKP